MWQIISPAVEFIGYVFAFWCAWKLFDGVFHLTKKKPAVDGCGQCVDHERQIAQLKIGKRKAEKEAQEKHKLDRISEESIALGQINIATQVQIEEISGIGPVKAANIIKERQRFEQGFPTWVHFERAESCCKNSIICWAKRRVGLMPISSQDARTAAMSYGGNRRGR